MKAEEPPQSLGKTLPGVSTKTVTMPLLGRPGGLLMVYFFSETSKWLEKSWRAKESHKPVTLGLAQPGGGSEISLSKILFYLITLHRVFPHRLTQFLITPICFWFFNCCLQPPEERCAKLNFKQFSHSENSRSSLGMNPKSSGKYYLPLLFDVPSLF